MYKQTHQKPYVINSNTQPALNNMFLTLNRHLHDVTVLKYFADVHPSPLYRDSNLTEQQTIKIRQKRLNQLERHKAQTNLTKNTKNIKLQI